MGRSTVCGILKETCEAIWTALKQEHVRVPSCEAEWVGISKQFEQIWKFPNCIGEDMYIQRLSVHFVLRIHFTYIIQVQSTGSTS